MASGKLGSADLAATADTLLYTVPANTVATINIRAANRNSVQCGIRIAIGSGASPVNADYISYDIPVYAKDITEETGIVCGAGEKVWARSDLANVSVRVHGFEEAA